MTGGEAGEAHGVTRLQLGVRQVAAVQLGRPGSRAGPQAAARPVQRLPHAGVRLRATLHPGMRPQRPLQVVRIFPPGQTKYSVRLSARRQWPPSGSTIA